MTDEEVDSTSQVAEAFDRDQDPLANFEAEFVDLDVDPFELFVVESVEPRDVADSTVKVYRRTHRQWRDFMTETSRHPACPAERHVMEFIDCLSENVGIIRRQCREKSGD